MFELSAWMWKLLRMKGEAVKSETMTQILTSSINKGGQEANRWQQGQLSVVKSDLMHIKDRRRKDNLETENRKVMPSWLAFQP